VIEFQKMEVENFLSITKGSVVLKDQGLVLIEGVNMDDSSAASNGAGKSSIVDAISWCLFGVTARGAKADAVINIQAGKNTSVRLRLEIDGESYVIVRGRKHPSLKNRVKVYRINPGATRAGEDYEDLTLGTDDATNRLIETLLGCNEQVFNASIYMGQDRMVDLPSLTDRELKTLIEESLGLSVMDDAHAIAKSNESEARDHLREVTDEIRDSQSKLESLRKENEFIDDQIDRSLSDLREITRQEEQAKEALQEAQRAQKILEPMRVHLTRQRSANDAELSGMNRVLDEIKSKVTRIRERLTVAEVTKDNLEKERIAALKALKNADKATTCPTCGAEQSADPDHIEKIKINLQNKVDQIKAKIKENEDLIKRGVDLHHTWKEKVTHHEGLIRDKKQDHENWEKKFLDDMAKKVESGGAASLNVAQRHLDFIQKMRQNRRETHERLEESSAGVIREILRVGTRLDELKIDEQKAEDRLRVATNVTHALSRKGFRGEVLDQITPYLNARTQHYLSELTDGNISATWETITTNAAGDYVESFRIDVKHQSGVSSFKNLSGGEKRKVRLATSLALQDLVATRAVKPIKLFVADEIDDAIDSNGLELLMGLLDRKGRDMGTVLVISHNDLKDYVRNTLTVTKQDGASTF